MNKYDKNKRALKHCPNYYKIVYAELMPEDKVIDRLLAIYEEYIKEVSLNVKSEVKALEELDKIIFKYLNDHKFKKVLSKELSNFRVKESVKDVLKYVVESIIEIYESYMDGYTRNIVIPRWI